VAAPALAEVAGDVADLRHELAHGLRAGAWDALVFTTGKGAGLVADALLGSPDSAGLAADFAKLRVVVRGRKSGPALARLGVRPARSVEAGTEVAGALAAEFGGLAGLRVVVQTDGGASGDVLEPLEKAGAVTTVLSPYRWELPADLGPLEAALARIAGGEIGIALFTSRPQVENVVRVAERLQNLAAVRHALGAGLVGSVGPVCSAALRSAGLPVHVQPEHAKMGHLVKAAAERVASR
jgi:uroporphyrinogen-III synthase